jgi:phytoene dehydrogenase-like protein
LAAHPFDNGEAAVLKHSLNDTAELLGADKNAYINLIGEVVKTWPGIARDVLGPLHFPQHPLDMAKFGISALRTGEAIAKRFMTPQAQGLFAGMSAHSLLPLDKPTTAAIALVLMANGHLKGWPIVKGGTKQLANALSNYFQSLGGKIQAGWYIRDLKELPTAKAVLFDVTPKQLLEIAGESFSSFYKWQLKKYRYGMGVFKVDWALDGPVPFTASACREAGTVHIGGTIEEIALSEKLAASGRITDKPFVLLAQQSLFDTGRAPEGKQVLWGYCHVPNGSNADRVVAIEKQVERFAPGFRDRILSRHTFNTLQLEKYNPNYIGGDINGGMLDIWQLFTRPALRLSPYRTSVKGLYICSASTPPGGGVHGMCGYNAAKKALADVWEIILPA